MSIYRTRYQPFNAVLRFGDITKKGCGEWKYYKSIENIWMLQIKSAVFNGLKWDDEMNEGKLVSFHVI
jgi:hypothetical protein